MFSNYCGLGGSGPVQHQVDQICKEHDEDYQTILDQGENPYLHYNWADDKMQKRLRRVRTSASIREKMLKTFTTTLWNAKKRFTRHLPFPNPPAIAQPKKFLGKRLRGAADAIQPQAPMALSYGNATRTNPPVGGASVTDETPITNQRPTYGIPNTHTTVLPYTAYFSVVGPKDFSAVPQFIEFSLDNYLNVVRTPISAKPNTGVLPTQPGVYNGPVPMPDNYWSTAGSFPTTLSSENDVSGADYAERPQWAQYFEKFYQFYTVLGVQYEFHFCNMGRRDMDSIKVLEKVDAYDRAQAKQSKQPITTMAEATRFPGQKWHLIHSDGSGATSTAGFTKLFGNYQRGSKKGPVMNDGLTSRWQRIGVLPPLAETLTLIFYPSAPSAATANAVNSYERYFHVNCEFTIKYIVQFKELQPQLKWPSSYYTDEVEISTNVIAQTQLHSAVEGEDVTTTLMEDGDL